MAKLTKMSSTTELSGLFPGLAPFSGSITLTVSSGRLLRAQHVHSHKLSSKLSLVKDLGSKDSFPWGLTTAHSGKLCFSAGATPGMEPQVHGGGTSNAAGGVTDAPAELGPGQSTAHNDKLCFGADDGTGDTELWRGMTAHCQHNPENH